MEKVIRDTVDSVEKQIMKDELRLAVDKLLKVLTERCRRVLSKFSEGYSLREIAAAEDWKDADKAKKERYECHLKLRNYLSDNPEIAKHLKDLLNG
jgi:DNA-directed RNA polymerase specialized sigma24 family protein